VSVCSSASPALQLPTLYSLLSLPFLSLKSYHLRCSVFTSKSTFRPKPHLVESLSTSRLI
jgi:hypothetical protein